MHEPVQDRISKGWVGEIFMPSVDRELARDERGARIDAVIEHFQEIGAIVVREAALCPVVDQKQIGAGQGGELAREAAVAVGDAKLLDQARGTNVERGEALTAGGLSEGAAQPRLAGSGCADEDQVLGVADPIAACQRGEVSLVWSYPEKSDTL